MSNKILLVSLGIILLSWYVTRYDCSETIVKKSPFAAVVRRLNFNDRTKRLTSNSRENNDLGVARRCKPRYGHVEQDIRVKEGKTATLHCVVHNVGNYTVVWRKVRGERILTCNTTTVGRDSRFHVFYDDDNNDWVLRIANTKYEDRGVYECRVTSYMENGVFYSLYVTRK